MFRTALRNVLAHKARLLMTVLAVMLGVAFVSGTLVFASTISEAYQKSSQKGFDNVDVAIQAHRQADDKQHPDAAPELTQRMLDQAEKAPGAAFATASINGFAAIADKKGKLIGEGFGSSGANYYPGTDGKDARYPLKDGRAPKSSGEIALDAKAAERGGYQVGDTVRISVDGPVLKQRLTGVFTTNDGNVSAGGSLALFDTATAQKFYAKPGKFSEIGVKAAPGTSQDALKASVQKILPRGTEAVTGKQLADEQAKLIAEESQGMRNALLGFAGVALVVGIFVIANTFTMLVAQRTKELALLRAVGASRRQVTRSVLIEALVVGTIAGVTGLLAGIGIGAGLRSLMNGTESTVPDGPLVISPAAILTSLAVGVLVTVLAAWLPGRRAAKIPPVAAMNSVHAVATTRSLTARNTIGGLLSAAGAVSVLAGTGMRANGEAPTGLGFVLVLIGVCVLTPLLSRLVIAAFTPALRLFGISGKLARQNALRNPRRTAATASALMIGLTLITGMTVVAGGAQRGLDKLGADSMKADYAISMAGGSALSPDIEKKLARLPQVTATSPLRQSPARADGSPQTLTGLNSATVTDLVRADFTAGSFAGFSDDKAIVDEDTAKSRGWKLGSAFTVTYEDGKQGRLTVSGIYKDNDLIRGIMVDARTLAPHQSVISDTQVLVKTKAAAGDAAKDSLGEALGDNPSIQIRDKDDFTAANAQSFSLLLNMLYALLAMAVIVAVLGVVNTLAMSVFERSQEIGMLRAIGLDRKDVKRMVRLESLALSLFGGVLGITLGIFFGWATGELISKTLGTYELVLPWGRMAVFLFTAAIVGVLAALWPARRAAKLNMLEAVSSR
ncbi:ABC transporter permease [Streptomyces sp. BA2]|uniref:ABC transporter permease n=1 Tax=Streptomyces sp. BA2 TaxID=436595 RepID=UPI001321AECC|nr:ABC transporter permease [Streptomyces sp. BA2]MWA07924.1 FtsX-like permease family protein [Streptomyces sp. BA2]